MFRRGNWACNPKGNKVRQCAADPHSAHRPADHSPEIDSSCELRGSARRTTARLYRCCCCCCCTAAPGKAAMRGATPAAADGAAALSGASGGTAPGGDSSCGSVTLNSFWPVSGRGSCHAAYAQLPLPPLLLLLLPACDMVRLCVENSAVVLATSQPQALRDLGFGGSNSPPSAEDPLSTLGMRTVAAPCMRL